MASIFKGVALAAAAAVAAIITTFRNFREKKKENIDGSMR